MTYAEPANLTTFADLMRYDNAVTGNLYGVGMLVAIYISLFYYLLSRGAGAQNSAVASGFVTTILGTFFFFIQVLTEVQLFFTVALFVLPVVWAYFSKS